MGDIGDDVGVPNDTSGHSLPLEPYLHQVSGHSCLLALPSSGCVLKPCYSQELTFYSNMPADMRTFTPGFHGEIPYNITDYNLIVKDREEAQIR